MTLSVVMIMKNAGEVVEDALESVKGLWSELLVDDDGSTDGTRRIIQQYGGQIFSLKDKNLGERKQWLVGKAKGEWILILDSDERVSDKLKKEIQQLLKNQKLSRGISGFNIPYQNYVFEKPVYYGGETYSKVRLFRKGKGSIELSPVHEEIVMKGNVGELKGVLHHYSYRSFGQLFNKFTRYALIAAEEKKKHGESISFAKLFLYGPHMFWARFMKEKGYEDGWRGFILAFAFAYMEQIGYWFLFTLKFFPILFLISMLLGFHLIILLLTNFIDWPEMLLYPWFLSKGLLYYRDVVLAYVPGAYYILYGFYKILGFSPSSLRIVAYFFILSSDVLLFWISSQLFKSRFISTVLLLFFMLWLPIFTGNTIWYETILLPFYLLAFYYFYRFIFGGRNKYLFLSGLFFACTLLIKQTAVLPITFSIILFLCQKRRFLYKALPQAIAILLVSVTPLLLVWMYYLLHGVGSNFFYWVFIFPSVLTRLDYYYLLSPSLGDIFLIGPAFLPIFFSLVSLLFIWRIKQQIWPIIMIIGWSVTLFFAGSSRWGMHRLVPALAFSALAMGYVFTVWKNKIFVRGWKKYILSIFLIVLLVGSIRSFAKFIFVREKNATSFFGKEYMSLANFTANKIGNAPFFVFGNYDYLYFFFDRKPTVLPWTPMFPWNAKVSGVQEAVVASLEQTEIPYILYIPYHKNSRFYAGYYPEVLGDYIFSKYSKLAPLPVDGWLLKRQDK